MDFLKPHVIHIKVAPTVSGIREGKDAALESAVEILRYGNSVH
jgi:hypothetical protein